MNPETQETAADVIVSPGPVLAKQVRSLSIGAAVLLVAFALPLYKLFRFAIHSELFSYILLVPFISAYLVWIQRGAIHSPARPNRALATALLAVGLCLLIVPGWKAAVNPQAGDLSRVTFSFVVLFYSLCFFTLGVSTLKVFSFPLLFLLFLVPLPGPFVSFLESFLQYTSAWAADLLFTVTGMSFLRQGLLFQLPGIRLEVAPECSGIHSTLVLFVVSLVAGQLFLSKVSHRAVLTLAVVPLGILRNAFRIWTLGELCVHVSPAMIDSPIHHRGGPIFFAVSLVPLFLLLFYLRRAGRKK